MNGMTQATSYKLDKHIYKLLLNEFLLEGVVEEVLLCQWHVLIT